jgi:predicted O-methyltransferase YrrM
MDLLASTKKRAARFRNFVNTPYRRLVLRRALQQVAESSATSELAPATIQNLIYGWGDNSWSAKAEFIQATVQAARQIQGPILECGSGLTTLLLGLVAGQNGRRVWSLEHNASWAKKVQNALARHSIHGVNVCLVQLRDYQSYVWYAAPKEQMPTDFALVVCDGPPGNTLGGRYGLLPQMRAHIRPGCIVLLDDAARPGEQQVLQRWAQEFGSKYTIVGSAKPFSRLVVPG